MRNRKTKEKAPKTPEERILETVALFYDVSPKAMKSPVRCESVSWARHVAMYLTWRLLPQTYKDIAKVYNRTNHGTVSHAIQKVRVKITESEALAKEVQKVSQAFAA